MKWQPYLTQVCVCFIYDWLHRTWAPHLWTRQAQDSNSPTFTWNQKWADIVEQIVGLSPAVCDSSNTLSHSCRNHGTVTTPTRSLMLINHRTYHRERNLPGFLLTHILQNTHTHTHTQPNQGRLLFSYDNGNRCKTLLPRKITVRTGWRAVVRDKSTEYDSWAWYKQQNSLVS